VKEEASEAEKEEASEAEIEKASEAEIEKASEAEIEKASEAEIEVATAVNQEKLGEVMALLPEVVTAQRLVEDIQVNLAEAVEEKEVDTLVKEEAVAEKEAVLEKEEECAVVNAVEVISLKEVADLLVLLEAEATSEGMTNLRDSMNDISQG
jgi:superfamily II DNA or RNA helicase